MYGIDNTIKTQLLERLDRILDKLKKYNGKEIIKEEDLSIDFRLCNLNKYIDGLNKDEKLTNSLVFGVIKSVIKDFRKEYYNTIGIDISEEKEEDVSVNRVRYFDKYLNGEKEIKRYIIHLVCLVIFKNISILEDDMDNMVKPAFNIYYNFCKYYYDLLNLGNKTQEQQEVCFNNNEEFLKSKSGSDISFSSFLSDDYTSVIEDMEEVVNQTNSRSSSPTSCL